MAHPHPSRRHVMVAYRQYLLGVKRKSRLEQQANARKINPNAAITHITGSARSLVHYKDLLREYLEAKRDVLAGKD